MKEKSSEPYQPRVEKEEAYGMPTKHTVRTAHDKTKQFSPENKIPQMGETRHKVIQKGLKTVLRKLVHFRPTRWLSGLGHLGTSLET